MLLEVGLDEIPKLIQKAEKEFFYEKNHNNLIENFHKVLY